MWLDLTPAMRSPGIAVPFTHGERVPAQDILGDTITFDDPVLLEGTMVFEEKTVRLTGTLTARVHAHCANCLNDVQSRLTIPVAEVLISQEDGETPGSAPEEDDDRFCYRGAQADVSHLILTNLVLALPIRFLCREDCRGLLDEQPGAAGAADSPFSKLSELLPKDEEE